MIFREATSNDISQIQVVRNAVKENRLSDPSLVTNEDCENFIHQRGKGWVCEAGGKIVGFAIADLVDNNIWALFVLPEFEHKGIGKTLQRLMLDWYFSKDKLMVWLGTAPGSRAAAFYRKSGWSHVGDHGKHEIKFEMTRDGWQRLRVL